MYVNSHATPPCEQVNACEEGEQQELGLNSASSTSLLKPVCGEGMATHQSVEGDVWPALVGSYLGGLSFRTQQQWESHPHWEWR